MDRYDRILADVLEKNAGDRLKWVAAPTSTHADVVLNAHRILRCYLAEYDLGDRKYELLFLVKKEEQYDPVFGDLFETREYELLVLQGKTVVLSLIDGIVERDQLLELASYLRTHNSQTTDFFAAFERSKCD